MESLVPPSLGDVGMLNRAAAERPGGNDSDACCSCWRSPYWSAVSQLWRRRFRRIDFPVATVELSASAPETVHGGNVQRGWLGRYLILYLPGTQGVLDGRDDFYDETLLHEFTESPI